VTDLAAVLLQSGLVVGAVLVVQLFSVRHLPSEAVPIVLRGRIDLSNRMRPWLIGAAGVMVAVGLALQLG